MTSKQTKPSAQPLADETLDAAAGGANRDSVNQIDVLSYSWGVSQTNTLQSSGNLAAKPKSGA